MNLFLKGLGSTCAHSRPRNLPDPFQCQVVQQEKQVTRQGTNLALKFSFAASCQHFAKENGPCQGTTSVVP